MRGFGVLLCSHKVSRTPMSGNAFWTVLPTLLWILFLGGLGLFFRKEIRALLRALLGRVHHGASVRVAGVEIGAVFATPNQTLKSEHSKTARVDDGRRQQERN